MIRNYALWKCRGMFYTVNVVYYIFFFLVCVCVCVCVTPLAILETFWSVIVIEILR